MSPDATLYLRKEAAAQRQLDAAIRMFFAMEDDLAIHTVGSAALRLLLDLLTRKGVSFVDEALKEGLNQMAKDYSRNALSDQKLTKELHESGLADLFDASIRTNVPISIKPSASKREENKKKERAFSSEAWNFLKHRPGRPSLG